MVLSVLAAKTGYEPDMIEMDMALETELGVDSIKRVEILSDVQKELNVEAQDVAALARTQTVGEVVEAMIKELGGAAPAGGAAAPTPVAAPAAPAATLAAPASGGVSAAEATRVVLAVLAAKTGYEPDMIEMDMALETELGVDSIKRVEILSDVQKELNVEAQDVAALARTQTVGEVVEAMIKELGGAAPAGGAAAPTPVAAPAAPAATLAAPASGGVSSAQLTAANAQLAQQAQEIASLKAQVTAAASRPAAPAGREKPDQRVAIVGYSCILPGGENVNEAWDTIQAGLDCVRDLPNDRVDVTAYYSGSVDHNPVDKIYCTRGGFIPDFEFDPRECAPSPPTRPRPLPRPRPRKRRRRRRRRRRRPTRPTCLATAERNPPFAGTTSTCSRWRTRTPTRRSRCSR